MVERDFVVRVNRQDGTATVVHQPARTRWYVHPSNPRRRCRSHLIRARCVGPSRSKDNCSGYARHRRRAGPIRDWAGNEVFITGLFTDPTEPGEYPDSPHG
jgi:hypothetical protein